MHSQKKFDETLKNKLDSQEFPFDEANWEKAADMIDASRKSKNKAGFYILSTLIVLVCGVAGFYIFNTNSTNEQTSQNINATKINAEQLSKSVVIPDPTNTEEVNSSSNGETSSTPATEQTATSEKITSEKNAANETERETSKNTIASSNTLSKKANSTTGLNKASNNTISGTGIASIDVNKVEKKTAAKHSNEAIAKNAPAENKTPEPASENKSKILAELKPVIASTATIEKPVSNETANYTASTAAPVDKTEVAVAAIDTVNKEATKALNIDTASAVTEIAKPIVEPKLFKNFISFEAGADYLLGWKNPNSTDANGFNPIVGINYTHFFNKKIGFTIGAQYNTVSNLSYSSHTASVTSYAFGQENDITIITPVKLHYVVMPLKFNFAVNPQNIIGIGCNIGYLLNVDNKVDTYNERLNYTSEHSVSKTKGYVSGIKNFDTQLSLFYRKTIYKELSVNAEFLYGLSDVKDNTFFNSNSYERNVGFKLTLVLNAFKK